MEELRKEPGKKGREERRKQKGGVVHLPQGPVTDIMGATGRWVRARGRGRERLGSGILR